MQRNALTLAIVAALSLAAPLAQAAEPTTSLVGTTDAAGNLVYNFSGIEFGGFEFLTLTNTFTGNLTRVSINATLDASAGYTYADDLTIYVSDALATGGLLQVGGFSNLGASERHSWANGGSSSPGTTVIDSVALTTPISFASATSHNIYLGNGYGDPDATGTWTGSVTLVFAPVPEPETYALMLGGGAAVAAWVARRRRKDASAA